MVFSVRVVNCLAPPDPVAPLRQARKEIPTPLTWELGGAGKLCPPILSDIYIWAWAIWGLGFLMGFSKGYVPPQKNIQGPCSSPNVLNMAFVFRIKAASVIQGPYRVLHFGFDLCLRRLNPPNRPSPAPLKAWPVPGLIAQAQA